MSRFIRINMKKLCVTTEEIDSASEYFGLGGRGLTSRFILNEVPPTCEPLGSENKLVIAPGLLAGTRASSTNRISIGAKSPLTGGIKESNGGGITAYHLAKLNIKAIIIEGLPEDKGPYIVKISARNTEILAAPELKLQGVYSTTEKIYDQFGRDVAVITIGPAGEMGLASAGITNTDPDGNPTRYCARGGLGAVMGSKGLKAIVIEGKDGNAEISRKDDYWNAVRRMTRELQENKTTGQVFPKFGTAVVVNVTQSLGGLPTRNFTEGHFDQAEEISGEKMYETIVERGGEGTPIHACMPGCVIRCSNVYPDQFGKKIVSPIEYETLALMGSNLAIGDLDTIARLNYICNDLGVDTIEMGGAIGVAMDVGLLSFGDSDAVMTLLEDVRQGTPLGRLIGSGSTIVGKVLNASHVPAVKGQHMAGYEPRAIKGIGVTYATSPMGADHTAGITLRAPVDHLKPEGQVEASLNAQVGAAILDTMGLCLFTYSVTLANLQLILDILATKTGLELCEEELNELGKRVILDEVTFNRVAGLVGYDIPESFRRNQLPSTKTVFDVAGDQLQMIFK